MSPALHGGACCSGPCCCARPVDTWAHAWEGDCRGWGHHVELLRRAACSPQWLCLQGPGLSQAPVSPPPPSNLLSVFCQRLFLGCLDALQWARLLTSPPFSRHTYLLGAHRDSGIPVPSLCGHPGGREDSPGRARARHAVLSPGKAQGTGPFPEAGQSCLQRWGSSGLRCLHSP